MVLKHSLCRNNLNYISLRSRFENNESKKLESYYKIEKLSRIEQRTISPAITKAEETLSKKKKNTSITYISLKSSESILDAHRYSIKNYFSAHPNERKKLREKYAENIRSVKDVVEILEWGNSKSIQDAYDGAIDLLAECNEKIFVNAIDLATDKYLFQCDREQVRAWEKNWEILIKGLSFSNKVQSFEKLSLILRLFLSNDKPHLTRSVKTAIIDALLNLQEEIDPDILELTIERFCSEARESDKYVREYAKEAIADLSQV